VNIKGGENFERRGKKTYSRGGEKFTYMGGEGNLGETKNLT